MRYIERGDGLEQNEYHHGYAQENTREVMGDLRLWNSDAMSCWIGIICRFLQRLGVVWTIFGVSKRLQFTRCRTTS